MEINGFLVVRLPHLNFLVPGRDVTPCIANLCYAGIDRQRWSEVFDEDYFAGRAPDEISALCRTIKESSRDLTGIELCQDLCVALKLLDYSNRKSVSNELITMRAPSFRLGVIETDLPIEWMGYDFIRLGEWSLIAGGLFMYPHHYSGWVNRINQFGLFDDSALLADYELFYENAVEQGQSEPLGSASSSLGTIAIEVGRVRTT